MLRARFVAVLAFLAVVISSPHPLLAQANFDRPGGDYLHTTIPSGDPQLCALRCERDRRCRAWSFSYPSIGEAGASCWLKNSVPQRVRNSTSVTGVRGAGVIEPRNRKIEMSTDRFGGDYRSFSLKPDSTGAACKSACDEDNKCRAWTYARPGYTGADARCFLKNQIKPPHRRPGLISGVVR
jgi:hypothetical protein